MKKVLIFHFIPVLLLIALGLSLFTPIYGDMSHRILGSSEIHNTMDGYQNIWNFWWAKKNCLGFCGNMWQTDYQFSPIGTSLLFETWAYPSLYILTPLMFAGLDAVTVYNVALILAVITALVAAYILVYDLTKTRLGSLLGAMTYGFSPFVLGHVFDGQLNLANVAFFPLFLLFLFKVNNKKGNLNTILAATSLLLLGLNDYVFLMITFMIWAIYLAFNYFANKESIKTVLGAHLKVLVVFLIPFIIFSTNNFRLFNNFELTGKSSWNAEYSSANLSSFFTPPNYTLIGSNCFAKSYKNIEGIFSDKTVYLGIVSVALSILGLVSLRRNGKKEIWFWIPLGLVSFILALGPKLHIITKTLDLWLPFRLLQALPMINIIRAPSRFTIIIYLTLSVLVGYGFAYLRKKIQNKYALLATGAGLLIILLVDYYPVKIPETDLYMPQGYQKIMEDKSDFAILESPPLWMNGLRNQSVFYTIETLYYQTIHGKKISGGYVTRTEKGQSEAYAEIPLVKFLINQKHGDAQSASLTSTLSRYSELYAKNLLFENPYKYFVMVKNPTWKEVNNNTKIALKDYLIPFYEDDEVEIFTFKEVK